MLLFAYQVIINEIAPAEPSDTGDWIELKCISGEVDISSWTLRTYLSQSNPPSFASAPVILKDTDEPSTPYDDRFVVIHLVKTAEEAEADETSATGDLNGNQVLDIYFYIYSGLSSKEDYLILMNGSGGIEDVAITSNTDGTVSSTFRTELEQTVGLLCPEQWLYNGNEFTDSYISSLSDSELEEALIDVSKIEEGRSVARKNDTDTNTKEDWMLLRVSTPGTENIQKGEQLCELSLEKTLISQGETVIIAYSVSFGSKVFISVYDSMGTLRQILVKGLEQGGASRIYWEVNLPVGVYFLCIKATGPNGTAFKRVPFVVAKQLGG